MWKDYSSSYIRKNRASSVSIMAAALIAAVFLTLLTCLFYNAWRYEVERIRIAEGDWQGRIAGPLDDEALALLAGAENVDRAVVNGALSTAEETVADVYLHNVRTIYRDLPKAADRLGLPPEAVSYHRTLLSRYLIEDPEDPEPSLLLPFYLAVLAATCLSLILIIQNAFSVSGDARLRQLATLAGIGATPGQIRACVMQEAAALCTLPILLGSGIGIGLTALLMRTVNAMAADVVSRQDAAFQLHPLVYGAAVLSAAVTVLVSAWIPARKLSRISPLAAFQSAGAEPSCKKRNPWLLARLFGAPGMLAGYALHRRRKSLAAASLSLTLSFLGLFVMLGFVTLSDISTNHTYFERYQNAWDVMLTVKTDRPDAFPVLSGVRGMENVRDCVAYGKGAAVCRVPEEAFSAEVLALGGPAAVAGEDAAGEQGVFSIRAPLIVLDDEGFLAYCRKIGAEASKEGAVVLNRVWDKTNSSFRNRQYVPYIRQDRTALTLVNRQADDKRAALPVLAYAGEGPVLREEYADGALTLILSRSLWETLSDRLGPLEPDIHVRILAREGMGLAELDRLQTAAVERLREDRPVESENRLQEKAANDRLIAGFRGIVGGLCGILALIGIANVFSNTLCFLGQRKREFARYLSLGMTPGEMARMLCVEALTVAGRPVLITLPIAALALWGMIGASRVDPAEFFRTAPIGPVALFVAAVFAFVALAYWIGGRRMLKSDLMESLRDATMI